MTDQNAIRDDLSFLRAMAEEGRDIPLTAGPPLLSSGATFGVACAAAAWGGLSGRITEPWVYVALFLGAGLAHAVVMRLIASSPAIRRGAASRANLATNLAWTAVATSIVATTLALIAIAFSTQDWRVMIALPSIVMAAYGGAWSVAAAVSRQRWLWLVALGAFALAIGEGAVAGSAVAFYGLFVAGVFLLVALPGLVLTLKARRAA
jgi:hypothetical protein